MHRLRLCIGASPSQYISRRNVNRRCHPAPLARQTLPATITPICGIHTTHHPIRARNPHGHFGYNDSCLPKPNAESGV
ncbi:hypothetical protein [Paralysiella testudinis]|uniref:Uncharacterized protein n=1 Tax=Paralysiella testudinis TaxID=2809020 RepID=A0A892ZJJ2_9NEIS|nr:hypothetical protein [Paralysiella testudinis]QRQ82640.1 hypothetical protein JQU52_04420 [Paralysiella testudinis]